MPQIALFVMLNPSTADATQDDPTIRRCIGYGKRLSLGGIGVVNLFTLRTPSPKVLWATPPDDRNHSSADDHLFEAMRHVATTGGVIIAGWGAVPPKDAYDRIQEVCQYAHQWGLPLNCLGTTKDGHPRHPLYLRADAPLTAWHGRL